MPTLSIQNISGQETEKLELPEAVFNGRVNTHVIHQAIVMYQASQRQGNASTKERGAVSGGGKKPWRQKGTGRARAGSTRSPLWHKGGVVFGPHPRDFGYSVPKKIRTAALRESLNAKYADKNLLCVDQFNVTTNKTKDFAKVLDALKLQGKILAVLDKNDEKVVKISRNIAHVSLARVEDVNAYDILRSKKILLSKSAFKKLLERIQ